MAEKKVIEIDIESNIGSLKSQLREAQAEVASLSDKFGATSREATEAAKRAAELKDRIGDAKALTDAFNPDAKFNALSASIGGVLNGFQAYEGALGLIGVENEDLQKTLLKVQSAMALSQGLQGLLEAKDSFKQLGAVVKNNSIIQAAYAFIMGTTTKAVEENTVATETNAVAGEVSAVTTEVQAGANVGLAASTNIATLALRAFKAALIATGIGVVVVLLGFLISNFDKVTAVVQKLSGYVIKAYDYFDNLGTSVKVLIGIFFPLVGVIYSAIKALEYFDIIDTKNERDQNARHKLEVKRADQKIKKLEEQKKARDKAYNDEQGQLTRQIALLEAQGKSTDALEEKKIRGSINYQKQKLKELELEQQSLGFMIKSTGTIGEAYKGLFDENAKAIDDIKNNIADSENQLNINSANNAKERADAIKEAAEKAKEGLYTISDEEMKRKESQRQMDAENLKEYLSVGLDAQKAFEERFKDVKKTSALEAIQNLSDSKTKELAINKEANDKQIAQDKEAAEKKKQLDADVMSAKFKIATDTLSLISNVTELFGRNDEKRARQAFKIDKAAKISSAIISGIEGTINAYKTAQSSPITAVFPPYPAIQAGLAGAFAATNIAKISSTQFGASNGSNVNTSGSGGSAFTPSFNVVGNSGINQLANLQQQPVKAYITTGEVSTALSLERNTLQKTTF